MTLSNDEKKLLRKAICAGAFTGTTQTQSGLAIRPITDKDLEAIGDKTDEEIRAVLSAYKATLALNLQNHIASVSTQNIARQGDLDALNALQIS